MFAATPKNSLALNKHRDLTRYVKWPRYVRIQRARAVLHDRLKVPPFIHQFDNALNKSLAVQVFGMLNKYRPETTQDKKARINAAAQAKVEGKEVQTEKPVTLKYGLNHVVSLIEKQQAKLVVIAHDVDPIELVAFLPTLCHKMNVPYCIVKGKSRLGQLVHQKNAAVVALTEVRAEDNSALDKLVEAIKANVDYKQASRKFGDSVLSNKSQQAIEKLKARQNQ